MALSTSNTTILARSKALGITIVVGKCIDGDEEDTTPDPFTGTTVVVHPSLKYVFAAIATYNEDPGDVQPLYASTTTGEEVIFTITEAKPVSFVIIGAD